MPEHFLPLRITLDSNFGKTSRPYSLKDPASETGHWLSVKLGFG